MPVLAATFLVVLCNKKSADVTILQGLGLPYSETAPGEITNQLRLIIENRSGRDAVYKIEIAGSAEAHFAVPPEAMSLRPGRAAKTPLAIVAPAAAFERGSCDIKLRVSDDKTFQQDIACRLLGPVRRRGGESFRNCEMTKTMQRSLSRPPAENPHEPSRAFVLADLLTSLIRIHVVSVVVMVIVATHDSSFAVEPDWYQKGLHYDQTAEQQRENSRLDWSVRLEVGQPLTGTNQRNVTCTVHDRAGKPVENATVDVVAFAHLRASNRTSSVFLPKEGGEIWSRLAFEDPGVWEFRLVDHAAVRRRLRRS